MSSTDSTLTQAPREEAVRPPHTHHTHRPAAGTTFGALLRQGARQLPEAVRKLDPRTLWRSPVMFLVLVGSVVTTAYAVAEPSAFTILIAFWLWLTILFGNLAEAVAEGRGKAQAASLRATRTDTIARLLGADGTESQVPATRLRVGDRVVVETGGIVPGDGDIVEGIASVDGSTPER